MKKLIIFLILSLFLPLVSSVSPFIVDSGGISIEYPQIDFFKVNTTRTFNFHVINQSTILTNSTASCYVDIYRGTDGAHILSKSLLGYDGRDFFVSANVNNFTDYVMYSVVVYCNTSFGQAGLSKTSFKVNPLGIEYTTSQAILHLVFIIAAFVIFFLFLYGSLKIPYRNPRNEEGKIIGVNDLKYLKIISIAFAYITIWFISGLLRGITAFYIPEIGIYRFFNWIYWILFSVMWPTIVVTLLLLLINLIDDKKIRKALERGFEIE